MTPCVFPQGKQATNMYVYVTHDSEYNSDLSRHNEEVVDEVSSLTQTWFVDAEPPHYESYLGPTHESCQNKQSLWVGATSAVESSEQTQMLQEAFACDTTYGKEPWRQEETVTSAKTFSQSWYNLYRDEIILHQGTSPYSLCLHLHGHLGVL